MKNLYYYQDCVDPEDIEMDSIDLYHSLVRFIAIGTIACGVISLILFYIL